MIAVFKRELKTYLHNVYGFLFMALLILTVGLTMTITLAQCVLYAAAYSISLPALLAGQLSIEYALYPCLYVLMILVPILCMRSMTEDQRNKTDLFYLSLPLRPLAIVLGKYLALLAIFAIPCVLVALLPLILGIFGIVNFVQAYLSILFFFLAGAALLAICLFLSSLTESPVVSAVLGVAASVGVCLVPVLAVFLPDTPVVSFVGFVLLGLLATVVAFVVTRNLTVTAVVGAALIIPLSLLYIFLGEHFGGLLPTVLEYISPLYHFKEIADYGILDLSSFLLILSYPVLFVYLTILSADRKRFA